jgi:hypothetical protein
MTSADNVLADAQDAFDNLITNRTNVVDLASHYPYSPERWRLFVDGSRVFPEYADPLVNGLAQYSHGRMPNAGGAAADVHTITPQAGETVVLETTERPRYVVQFELAATLAAQLNQELVGDDRLRLGLFDGTDGWYFEQRSDLAADECELVSLRAGSEIYRTDPVNAQRATTAFARLRLVTGWYNITRQAWERSYSNNGRQENVTIGGPGVSADDQRGPETGNLPLRFEVTADASTSDLALYAGSAAQVNLGTTTQFTRTKTSQVGPITVGTADTWLPIAAIRVDPNRDITNCQLRQLDPEEFTGNGDIKVIAMSVAPSKTDASGFATPESHSEAGSVIEETTSVTTSPDSGGTTVSSATNPGGFQVGYGSLYSSQGGTTAAVATRGGQKRFISGRDVIVILANATTTGDVTIEYQSEQDW